MTNTPCCTFCVLEDFVQQGRTFNFVKKHLGWNKLWDLTREASLWNELIISWESCELWKRCKKIGAAVQFEEIIGRWGKSFEHAGNHLEKGGVIWNMGKLFENGEEIIWTMERKSFEQWRTYWKMEEIIGNGGNQWKHGGNYREIVWNHLKKVEVNIWKWRNRQGVNSFSLITCPPVQKGRH